ncbi:glycoside hydrolase family 2 protein [Planctomonas psychrotolerans]|uniref:glycoside hydrolase family 2 protein n=1 Tax=Planctomonas psychrotolerans TaxID=2528712 RepID=UPI00123BA732|nr:glycoside hydrolase family 2 protein [Planctomonas psychrotolerans]
MSRTPLNSGWTLRPTGGPIPDGIPAEVPATVPGTVHTDLLAAGLIPDPYLDLNEHELQWIGDSDFTYATSFAYAADGHERVDLVAEGLDTVAAVTLNGTLLGRTRNQHRSYRFDVRALLEEGENELAVEFASPVRSAREAEARMGAKPFVGNALPYNALRKMACNFGWDWGPVLTTAGIWKPMYLHAWSTARIVQVVPLVTVSSSGSGTVELRIELECTGETDLTLDASVTGPSGTDVRASTVTTGSTAVITLEVEDPELWWPRGYGDQPLYEARVVVSSADTELDSWTHDIGFRTVEVRVAPDEFGTSFEFSVNGQYVFIKGANWIPDDCFLPRITRESYEKSIRDAVDADMNMLRIWGGGIYESDDLYDICNREGLLVWQDFLFACAAYSEADELRDEVAAEARENVARLAPNPSLVFWNGSNENVEGFYHWGWKEKLAEGEDWGRDYYDNLLPAILAEVDPTRGYLPSSPFSPENYATPRDPEHGPVHSWEVWNRQDYTTYRDDIPRFVSEFGYQGPPNFSTLTRSVHDSPMAADSPGVLSHQKAEDGNGKLARGYAPHLPEPTNFDDWHFTTQLNQARAIAYGVEHFRSYSPRTAGSIIWQLNDCWPVTSWAAVDGDKRRKPLWYALRSVNAPRLLTIQPRGGSLALVASNDSPEAWVESVEVRRVALDGTVLDSQTVQLDVPSRTNATVPLGASVTSASTPTAELIVAASGTARPARWYFVEDLELAVPALDIDTSVEAVDGGYAVTVTANTFTKDIVLNADRLSPEATVDEMLVTLLPGESHRFTVTGSDLDVDAMVQAPVLQSVNALLSARG